MTSNTRSVFIGWMSDPRSTVALPRRSKGRDEMNQATQIRYMAAHRRSTRAQARALQAARLETTLAVVLLTILAISALVMSANSREVDTRMTQVITVGQSDSLWELASAHPVPGVETAELVRAIAEMNDLDTSTIVPGQRLVVPASDDRVLLAVR